MNRYLLNRSPLKPPSRPQDTEALNPDPTQTLNPDPKQTLEAQIESVKGQTLPKTFDPPSQRKTPNPKPQTQTQIPNPKLQTLNTRPPIPILKSKVETLSPDLLTSGPSIPYSLP